MGKLRLFSEILCQEIWDNILKAVGKVFGNELRVVVLSQGEQVQNEMRSLAPRRIRLVEDMDMTSYDQITSDPNPGANSLIFSLEQEDLHSTIAGNEIIAICNDCHIALSNKSSAPNPTCLRSTSAHLCLHIYSGYGQFRADYLMSHALEAFASSNLRNLFFSSDTKNLHIPGHGRRAAQGRQLYEKRNSWSPLLPSNSNACRTFQELALGCALFWSEIAPFIPHLQELKRLDVELALLRTEPIYLFELLTKEEAQRKVLETCLNEETMKKEWAMKKDKGKKWIAIGREGILLSWVDPDVPGMPIHWSDLRFMSVDERVCQQMRERRFLRSKNI